MKHRALAAQVLGYARDKAAVVDDLVYGIGDPGQNVRNNAMRALLVISKMTPSGRQAVPPVPAEPPIDRAGSSGPRESRETDSRW